MARPSHWEARLAELLPELQQFALRLTRGNTNKADAAVSDAYTALIHELRAQPATRAKRPKRGKRSGEPLIFADDAAFTNWCRARVGTIAGLRYANSKADILARDGRTNDSRFRAKVKIRAERHGRGVKPKGCGPDKHIEHDDWIGQVAIRSHRAITSSVG